MVLAARQMQDLIHEFQARICESQGVPREGGVQTPSFAAHMTDVLASIEEEFRIVTSSTEKIKERLSDRPSGSPQRASAGAEGVDKRARDTSPKRSASLVH